MSLSIGRSVNLGMVLTVVALAAIAFAAYGNYFIQDDGFISLRYADHWARGYGPVWYPGSTEFGYTNFLFVALCAALLAAGVGPVLAAGVVTYAGFALAVLTTYAIVMRLTRDAKIAALCILVIFTNFTVSSYASGLLETSLQVALVLATYWGVIRYAQEPEGWLPFAIALAASLAMLTRLDSSLLLLPAGVYALRHLQSRRHLVVFLAIPTLVVGGFLVFCYLQYGQVLPNTFYVKATDTSAKYGIAYTKRFLDLENFQYVVFLSAMLPTIFYPGRKRDRELSLALQDSRAWLLAAPVIIWPLYVVYIGGGFMGFRLMVPVTIFFFVAFFLLMAPIARFKLIAVLVGYALLANVSHKAAAVFRSDNYRSAVGSPVSLNAQVTRPKTNWQFTGQRLGEIFNPDSRSDVVIAITAAGAIPFYSRLPTIDILGLNDRWVARNGTALTNAHPGHRRWAPLQYLYDRKVNLAIGDGKYLCGNASILPNKKTLARYGDAPVLLVKLAPGCSLIARYLTKHPAVELALSRGIAEKISVNDFPRLLHRSDATTSLHYRPRLKHVARSPRQ